MRRVRSKTHPAATQPRIDRLLKASDADVYGLAGKLREPTMCPDCGAVYRAGRWSWRGAPLDAPRTRCPACRRAADDYPAGIVRLVGPFVAQHGHELRQLAVNLAMREGEEHPMKRIIEMRPIEAGGLEITTTDARLARGIGRAVQRAYEGEIACDWSSAENVLRVEWSR